MTATLRSLGTDRHAPGPTWQAKTGVLLAATVRAKKMEEEDVHPSCVGRENNHAHDCRGARPGPGLSSFRAITACGPGLSAHPASGSKLCRCLASSGGCKSSTRPARDCHRVH